MRKIGIVVLSLLFIICISILLYYLPKARSSLISPWVSGSQLATNLWSPKVEASTSHDLELTAVAAYLVDADTGQVLYQKNATEKMPVASLAKIMTAMVTLDHKQWDDAISISKQAAEMEPDKMLLIEGETLSVKELIYGLFLVSANDGAEALAESLTGDREDFIRLMNEKAILIGMKDSHFINPTGLQEDNQKQYSTAYDVTLMARYAIKHYPQLVEISSIPHIILPKTPTHQDYDLYSGINLLTTYPGVVGFKTGFTPEAGMTLVTLAKRDGHTLIGVLLNAPSRRDDARLLLDHGFKQLGVQVDEKDQTQN